MKENIDFIIADLHVKRSAMDNIVHGLNVIAKESQKHQGYKRLFILGDLWNYKSYAKFATSFLYIFMETVYDNFDEINIMEGTPIHDYDKFGIFKYIAKINIFEDGFIDEENKIIYVPQKTLLKDATGFRINTKEIKWADIPQGYEYFFGHFMIDGVIINGKEISSDIIVSPDDILGLHAKYNFMGHVHIPQKKLDQRGIHYVGSMYPGKWGETDEKGFYIVKDNIVSRISFEMPRRYLLKDNIDKKEITLLKKQGHLVKIIADSKTIIDCKDIVDEAEIKREIPKSQRLYADKVVDNDSMKQKIKYYAKAKGIKITKGLLTKVEKIEKELEA